MPPHCDTLDGPVVMAAKRALDTGNVNLILPYAPRKAEGEIKRAFEKTLLVRKQGKEVKELADYWFFETVVRLHREGEGAAFEGVKPAGLDPGPVVPKAEKAIEIGNLAELLAFMRTTVEGELHRKFEHVMKLRKHDVNDVEAARRYVSAMLGFEVFSHHLYTTIVGSLGHGGEGEAKGLAGEGTGKHEH